MTDHVAVTEPGPPQAGILVVEPDSADAEALANILSDGGHRARVTHAAPDALAAIHEELPALVLVASDLGEISGAEFHAALTIDRITSRIPVIVTGPHPTLRPGRGVPQGASLDCVAKPFEPGEVLVRVRIQLELAALRDKHHEQTRILTLALRRLGEATRKTEENALRLRDSRTHLQTLIDNLPGLAYRCRNDAQWTMEFLSDGCLELTGHAATDLLFNKVLCYADLIHPEDEQAVRDAVDAGLARRTPYEMEYRIRHKDGTERLVWERGRGIFDPDGTLLYLDGLITDVTERRRAREEVAARLKQVETTMIGALRAISNLSELRDPHTAGHERRVAVLARAIGVELGLSPERCRGLEVIGLIHDVGKAAVPAQILAKPSALTPLEFELVKTHSQAGYDILKGLEFPWPVAEAVLQHHERLDGSGYPSGLRDGDILLEARILTVADVVAAMSSHRPYRPSLGVPAALEEITRHGRDRYDPDAARACVRLFREQGFRLPD